MFDHEIWTWYTHNNIQLQRAPTIPRPTPSWHARTQATEAAKLPVTHKNVYITCWATGSKIASIVLVWKTGMTDPWETQNGRKGSLNLCEGNQFLNIPTRSRNNRRFLQLSRTIQSSYIGSLIQLPHIPGISPLPFRYRWFFPTPNAPVHWYTI